MTDSVQSDGTSVSRLRELRQRVGLSAAALAKQAGLAPNTVRNAERGKPTERASQRAIGEALAMELQRGAYGRMADARAAVMRAELELEGSQRRLESTQQLLAEAEQRHERELDELAREVEALWRETHDDDVELVG